jgi:hypothetical protein
MKRAAHICATRKDGHLFAEAPRPASVIPRRENVTFDGPGRRDQEGR